MGGGHTKVVAKDLPEHPPTGNEALPVSLEVISPCSLPLIQREDLFKLLQGPRGFVERCTPNVNLVARKTHVTGIRHEKPRKNWGQSPVFSFVRSHIPGNSIFLILGRSFTTTITGWTEPESLPVVLSSSIHSVTSA